MRIKTIEEDGKIKEIEFSFWSFAWAAYWANACAGLVVYLIALAVFFLIGTFIE